MNYLHSLIGSLVLLPSLASVSLAAGDQPYEFTDLGDLGGGESAAYGLNDHGMVVGWSTISDCLTSGGDPCRRGFLWIGGTMIDLGVLPGDDESLARAINNAGTIVGTSSANPAPGSKMSHGVTWNFGNISPLPDLGMGTSYVYDINESGQMVGYSVDVITGRDHVAMWDAGGVTDLGASESHNYNRGYGINDAGEVVGMAWNVFSPSNSILFDGKWKTTGGGATPWQSAEAIDINNAGYSVGRLTFSAGSDRGAYWEPLAKSPIDAGLLPGMAVGTLHDVDESGLAVGSCSPDVAPFTSRATSFDGKVLRDLNELLPAGTNAELIEAREINNNGDIAGTAIVGGASHAFLLTKMEQWKHLGSGLAGAKGAPVLEGFGSLGSGTKVELQISNTPPGSSVFLAAGTTNINVPFFGGLLTPSPDYIFPVFLTDGAGEGSRIFNWAGGVPPGIPTFWQAWILDPAGPQGLTSTDAVTQVTH